jgi:hypothetical protein
MVDGGYAVYPAAKPKIGFTMERLAVSAWRDV